MQQQIDKYEKNRFPEQEYYFRLAEKSYEKGLTLRGDLERYLGLKLRLPALCRSWEEAEQKSFYIPGDTWHENDSIHSSSPIEVFNAIKELPRAFQINLLTECRTPRNQLDFRVGAKLSNTRDWRGNWVESSLRKEALQYLEYLEVPYMNSVWILQVAPTLLKENKISLDLFYLVTSFILPSSLAVKDTCIKVHNCLLPTPSIFSFLTSGKAKDNYIERTRGLLTEKEQETELAKFKL